MYYVLYNSMLITLFALEGEGKVEEKTKKRYKKIQTFWITRGHPQD